MSVPLELLTTSTRGRAETAQAHTLLHNMSCRPNVAVQHQGHNECCALRFGFQLPTDRAPSLNDILLTLKITHTRMANSLAAIAALALEPCPLLDRMPPVAAVRLNVAGDEIPGLTDQPLLILAVLARCGSGMFIRDRPPIVTKDRILHSVTLFAPQSWKHP